MEKKELLSIFVVYNNLQVFLKVTDLSLRDDETDSLSESRDNESDIACETTIMYGHENKVTNASNNDVELTDIAGHDGMGEDDSLLNVEHGESSRNSSGQYFF